MSVPKVKEVYKNLPPQKSNKEIVDLVLQNEISHEEQQSLICQQITHVYQQLVTGLCQEEIEARCGVSHERGKDPEVPRRAGSDIVTLTLGGQRFAVKKPRIKHHGKEVHLKSYGLLKGSSRLKGAPRIEEIIKKAVLSGVSMRDFTGLMAEISTYVGISAKSVSRIFADSGIEDLKQINHRDLAPHTFLVVYIDTIYIGKQAMVSVMGITRKGKKMFLGIKQGKTENAELVGSLLQEIMDRGLSPDTDRLFVIDGAKALKKAILDKFGDRAHIQRCRLHKQRNILSQVPEDLRPVVKWRWNGIFVAEDLEESRKRVQQLEDYLTTKGLHEALASFKEGQEDLLTVMKLNVPSRFRKYMHSTNVLESAISSIRERTQRIKNWHPHTDQALRWMAAASLHVEKTYFRTVSWVGGLQALEQGLKLRRLEEEDPPECLLQQA